MRTIRKGDAPYKFAQSNKSPHKNPPQSSEEAQITWKNFRGKRRKNVQKSCLTEQYYLCAYSEVGLADENSVLDDMGNTVSYDLGMHIEHVEPKSLNPQRTFDYYNLVVSAIETDKAKSQGLVMQDVFGGRARGNWNHPAFIHPLLENCRDYFFFEASTGKIVPRQSLPRRERAKARLTIYRLNLNAPILMLWRKTRLMALEEIINGLLSEPEALKRFCESELLPANGHLRPFHSAQRQLFGRLGEQICTKHEPPL